MSINAEIFEHPNAGFYYIVLQHNEVYEVSCLRRDDDHCHLLGQMWPNGEASLDLRLGSHLRLQDVPKEVRDRLAKLLINKIENV